MTIILDRIDLTSVTVNDLTEWMFAEIGDVHGARCVVELGFGRSRRECIELVSQMLSRLRGRPIEDERQVPAMLGLDAETLTRDIASAWSVSALRTAVLELQCQHDGRSMTEALGGAPRESVQLYANINRHLNGVAPDRSPRTFGQAAERAATACFEVIKCAPFDEVSASEDTPEQVSAARIGVERVAAVRKAVGPDVRVLVDCHCRFDVDAAIRVAQQLAEFDVAWFEEPICPQVDADGLASVAGKTTIPVAGGEHGYGERFFASLVERGAVAIAMPDVKYCGGVAEAYAAGASVLSAGGAVSLHSPSGPVSLLASAHVHAAIPEAMALEHAVYEAPWRAELVTPAERIEGGRIWFPRGPGTGVTLDPEVVERYGTTWKA